MGKTITLLASGTRGDVQPYVALGFGLQNAGHRVRVATHDAFAPLVALWGLEYFPLGENPSDLFARPENQNALRGTSSPLAGVRASYAYWQSTRPVYRSLVQNAWRAAQDSDALIFGLPTHWASELANALNIPGVRSLLQPLTPTRAFPCPLVPTARSLGAAGNRLSYTVCAQILHWAWRDALSAWQHAFHIPKMRAAEKNALTLYSFSPQLVPPPSDYPQSHHITGYWFLPESTDPLPSELEVFLDARPAPIYLGFGSITPYAAPKIKTVLKETARQTGLRFIIPRAFMAQDFPRETFCAIDNVSHAKLFPRLRAIIHHGGAGTTASASCAGVPQCIVPMYADTFFWGARVFAAGIGPRPLPETQISANALAARLNEILQNETMQTRAHEVSKIVARENGVMRAVELLSQPL